LGYGQVLLHPSASSGRDSVTYSDATFTGATTFNRNSGLPTTGHVGGLLPLPYDNSDVSEYNKLKYRLVSMGAKLRYTGTALNRGGTIYAYASPTGEGIENLTLSEITGSPNMVSYNIAEMDEALLVIHPVHRVQFELGSIQIKGNGLMDPDGDPGVYWWDTTVGSQVSGAATGGFMINSTPGNTFELEVVMNVEYAGVRVGSLATRLLSDQAAFNHAHDIVQRVQESKRSQPHRSHRAHVTEAISAQGIKLASTQLETLSHSNNKYVAMSAQAGQAIIRSGALNKGIQIGRKQKIGRKLANKLHL
jgi:hypothetical protein